MKIKYKIIGILSVLLIFVSACKESFLDSVPIDKINTANYYQNDDDFNKAINGVYNALEPWAQSMDFFPMIDIATPIAASGGGRFGAFLWGNMAYTPTSSRMSQEWWPQYWMGVARANEVIIKIEEKGSVITTPALRDRIHGEALFLRAYFYFYLTYLWGDVPLITGPLSGDDVKPARSPHAQVVEQMITDLKEAETLLPSVTEYRTSSALLGRVSKGAAMSLLGKVYCFEKRWSDAETELKKVIDSGDYKLTPGATGFIDQFWPEGENGIESIFEIQYAADVLQDRSNFYIAYATTAGAGINATGFGYTNPTDYLVDLFETTGGYKVTSNWISNAASKDSFTFTSADPAFVPLKPFTNRDPRLMWTVMYQGSPYLAWKFPANTFTADLPKETNYATVKYIIPESTGSNGSQNEIVIRYADVLLLYAEALMEQAKLTDAATYVNMVRQRPSVNMPVVPASVVGDQGQLRQYIHEERIRELSLEYGHVFFDLRRWGIYGQEMKKYWTANKYGHVNPAVPFDEGRDNLWPIPQEDRDLNPNLSQNPGYTQ